MIRRRTAVAIGASIVFHLVLLVLLLRLSGRTEPATPAEQPITVAIREVPPPAVHPEPPARHEPPVHPRPVHPEPRTKPGVEGSGHPRTRALPSHTALHEHPRAPRASAEDKRKPAAPAPPMVQRGPRKTFLVPRGFLLPPASGGHLSHNTGEVPDTSAQDAESDRQARAKVKGWLGDMLATQRTRDGLVDPYFRKLGRALAGRAQNPPAGGGAPPPGLVARALGGWQKAAAQYGKTGDVSSGESSDPELRALGRRLAPPMLPGSNEERIDKGLGGVALLRRNLKHHGFELVATVELVQAPDGHLLSAKLKQSSGVKAYDAYVLKAARAGTLPVPPPKGPGIRSTGIHSVWAFRRVHNRHGEHGYACEVELLGVY